MPEVFLSYSREDQATARRYAQALEQEGFRVWWDDALNPGETFDQVTEQALREARAVVVLWSKRSVESRWVRSEAAQADRYGTLAPVMIESCNRPILFELTHTADLSAWTGDRQDPAWRSFVGRLRRQVERTGGPVLQDAGPHPVALQAPAPVARDRWIPLVAITSTAVLLAGAAAWWALRNGGRAEASTSPVAQVATPAARAPGLAVTSVAVMPFVNRTGDPDKEFFGESFAEELINALGKVQGLTVASRTSSFAYKGKNVDMREIGRQLGVATVIEGSVDSAGDQIRITAQLVNAESGYQLWTDTYDRPFMDLFKLKDELTGEIVSAYSRTLGVGTIGFVAQRAPTTSVEAYVLYLRALYGLGQQSDTAAREGLRSAERAVELDPGFARGHWVLALVHSVLGSPVAEVERHARRAGELEPGIEKTLLVSVEARRGHWVAAEELYRSVGVDASDNVHVTSLLWPMGRLRDATLATHRAETAAPAAPVMANNLARLYASQGKDAEAVYWTEAAIARGADPRVRRTRQALYEVALHAGRHDEAAGMMLGFLPAYLHTPANDAAIREAYRAMADPPRRAVALAGLDAFVAHVEPTDWTVKVLVMPMYSMLGSLDQAYALAEALRLQFRDGSPLAAWAWLWTQEMAAFRRDARFQPFVQKLGMVEYWKKYGPPDACTLEGERLACR